jgi:hypothetical protein
MRQLLSSVILCHRPTLTLEMAGHTKVATCKKPSGRIPYQPFTVEHSMSLIVEKGMLGGRSMQPPRLMQQ